MKIQFTGNLFVDAGLAGMCAAADVRHLAQLDEAAIRRAVEKLISFITSDAAFKQRTIIVDGKPKKTAFATSEMSVIFPNSPLPNPSNKGVVKKQKYEARVRAKLDALIEALKNPTQSAAQSCFVDGNPACFKVGNDEFPLVDSRSKRNFHPGLGEGHPVGALSALAVEFFPLSVLRTGPNSGWFWFVHTAQEEIAVPVAELTRNFMNDSLTKGNFGFFGDWKLNNRGKETALVGLIRELVCGAQSPLSKEIIEQMEYPVTAYIFSNSGREPTIELHDLPHPLWKFFKQLRGGKSLSRWNREVLNANKKGWLLARAMLQGNRIVSLCLVRAKDSETEKETVMLRGGWNAHAHYAHEVLQMNATFIRDIEILSHHLFEHSKAKDWRFDLQKASGIGEVRRVLLRFCREKMLEDEAFARLAPPDVPYFALSTRDYLLAALYDRFHCAENNLEFEDWDAEPNELQREKSPVLELVESVGASLLQDERHNRLAADLAKATRTTDVRRVLLQGAKRGLISWAQWTEFLPPDRPARSLLMRDYLLAYIYTHMERDEVQILPEPAPVDAREARIENTDETEQFLALVS